MIAICYNQKEVQEHIEHFKHLIQEKNDQSVTYVIPFFKKKCTHFTYTANFNCT